MSREPFAWEGDPRWKELVAAARADTGGPDVWTYQSSHDPWLTSSYYLEADGEVLLVDTQTFRSSAEELWGEIQRNTSGELTTILMTHAHADHYYGNAFFKQVAPRAKIISSRGVVEDLDRTLEARVPMIHAEWGVEVPAHPGEIAYPDVVFEGAAELRLEDRTLKLWEVGPAEAPAQVVGWIPELGYLIAGDVVQNRQTYYVPDCALASWYAIVAELESLGPSRVFTGHQGACGPEIFKETRSWIASYLGLMAGELGPTRDPEDARALSDAARARILAEMGRRFPDWYDPLMIHPGDTTLSYSLEGMTTEEEGSRDLAAG
jgi:glyoxylase-like metal-dependent hydrolase (beta-lactamase superfamily II)